MSEYKNIISVAQLQALLRKSECRIVDCRFDLLQPAKGHAEYADGHIPGAVYADLNTDLAGPITAESGRHPLPDLQRFEDLLSSWGIEKGIQVVAYDHANGAVAARLWWLLRWVGHDRVAVLDGGYAAWTKSAGDINTDRPSIKPTKCKLQPNDAMVATTAEILSAVHSRRALSLLDARDAARFAGHTEPIDAVAGHIPGASNLPFMDALNAGGTWRNRGELVQLWRKALDGCVEGPVIAMCGSGVTACHVLLTAHQLDLDVPRLYVGSWSEWIRDGSREIATID